MPIVEGVEVNSFETEKSAEYGYVIVLIPASDGGPHRAMLKQGGDREYWKRSGDSFYRMEHFDIADMFGRRRRPKLTLHWTVVPRGKRRDPKGEMRFHFGFILGLRNEGRAIARYPMLELEHPEGAVIDEYGLDGNRNEGLRRQPTAPPGRRVLYVGDGTQVVYPGTVLEITRTAPILITGDPRKQIFDDFVFKYKIAAEDHPLEEGEVVIRDPELARLVPPLFGAQGKE